MIYRVFTAQLLIMDRNGLLSTIYTIPEPLSLLVAIGGKLLSSPAYIYERFRVNMGTACSQPSEIGLTQQKKGPSRHNRGA